MDATAILRGERRGWSAGQHRRDMSDRPPPTSVPAGHGPGTGGADDDARLRSASWPGRVAMTLSAGVAELHPADTGPDDLLARANAALYRAKTTRDTVCRADGPSPAASPPDPPETAISA